VEARDHPICHGAGGLHLADVLLEVDRVGLGLDRELVAETERLAEEIVAVGRALLDRVALVAAPLLLGLQANALADLAQLRQRLGVGVVALLVAEAVDARVAQGVVALVAGTGAAAELAAGGNERDAAAGSFEIGGCARFGQMAAGAGMHDAGLIEIAHG